MQVGISIGTSFALDGPDGHRAGVLQALGQARAARRAGLSSLTLGDHHSTGGAGYVQNVPLLGRLAAEWQGQMGCLFILPLWHPVLLAEQVGTLATMTEGPFIVQTGLGAGAAEFAAMGADLQGRGARAEEAFRLVAALLRGETVDSPLFGVKAARVAPLPPQGTEWWMGAGARSSIERVARLGGHWYANADLTPATAARAMDLYREACAAAGRAPGRVPLRRDVFIAEDRGLATRVGDALVASGYRGFEREAVTYGDPSSVAEQLSVYAELGFTDIVIRTMGPLPPELGPGAADRSVELAGDVMSLLA